MKAFTFTNFYSRGLRETHLAAPELLQYSESRDCSCLVGSWLLFSFPVQEWDYCLGRVKSISGIRIIYPWRCWASINSSWILLIHLNSNLCCLALRVQFIPFLIFSSPFPPPSTVHQGKLPLSPWFRYILSCKVNVQHLIPQYLSEVESPTDAT